MTDRAQRVMLWFLTLALIGGTVYALRFASGYRAAAGYAPLSSAPLPPDVNLRLEQVEAVGRDAGRVAWTVKADRVDTTRTRDKLQFSGNVKADILQNGKPRAEFSTPFAEFMTREKRLRATNQATPPSLPLTTTASPAASIATSPVLCVVHDQANTTGKVRSDDLRMETGEVLWDVGAKTVQCPGSVKARRAGTLLTGERFEVHLDTREFQALRFRARMPMAESQADETLPSLGGLSGR